MSLLNKQNIILAVLSIILLNEVVKWMMPTDPPINLEQEIELHDIRQERDLLQKQFNQKEIIIKKFEDEFTKIKNDPTVDTVSLDGLSQLFTDHINQGR